LELFARRGRPGSIPDARELVVSQTPYFLAYAENDGAAVILPDAWRQAMAARRGA
jgi:hypothetical protein